MVDLFPAIRLAQSILKRKFPSGSLTWGSEVEKTKLQKIVGNLLDKLRKLYMNGIVI